jgi:cytochrome P450
VAAADWDPRDPAVLSDQIRAYDQMRARCPVAYSDYLGWSVFRHDDIVAVVGDHETFSSAVSSHPAVPNGFDPPKHGPYRTVVDHYFTPEHMLAFEPVCRQVARDLIARLSLGVPVEIISMFALEFALEAQRAWLGWPAYTISALRHWTAQNHRATLARDREALDAVAAVFDSTVRRVLDDRRALGAAATENDITSQLMREQVDGVPLNDQELVAILRNWTVGELGTMSASLGILIDYMARHPGLQEELRGAPHRLAGAIDEILRIHSPLVANRRVATRDVSLGGRTISAGDQVTVIWASGNRDESHFGDPDEYQPHRNAPDNLLYGRGIHDCPGAPLARLELRVVMEELLAQTRLIEAVPGSTPDFASYPASGFRALRVRLSL